VKVFLFGGVFKKDLTPSPSPKERGTRNCLIRICLLLGTMLYCNSCCFGIRNLSKSSENSPD
jgi:hypothetical protein